MDVLCGTVYGGVTAGKIFYNEKPPAQTDLKSILAYCQQSDVLLPYATVREAITTAAMLRLPADMPAEEKRGRAEGVMELLGLKEKAELLIGDDTIGLKGISGGQRRRVSIAIELVRDPSIIFLDEPLSGLDSRVSVSLVEFLQELAQSGRTVAFSYHQPSVEVCSVIDNALFMRKGHILFSGPMTEAVDYVHKAGIKGKEALLGNPADFLLDVVEDVDSAEILSGIYVDSLGKSGRDIENGTAGFTEADRQATYRKMLSQGANKEPDAKAIKPATSAFFQFRILLKREIVGIGRNKSVLAAQLGQALIAGLILGVLFWDIPSNANTANFNRLSCLYVCITMIVGGAVTKAINNWDMKCRLIRRETMTRMYNLPPMFFAMQMAQFIVSVGIILIFSVVYPMVHFQFGFEKWLIWALVGLCLEVTVENMALILRYWTSSGVTYALINVILLVCAMLSGFLIPIDSAFLRFLNTIDFISYFFNTYVLNEFTGVTTVLPDVNGIPLCVAQWLQASVATALFVEETPNPAWDTRLGYTGNSTAALTAQQALVQYRYDLSNYLISPEVDPLLRSPDVDSFHWPVRLPSNIDL
jgi:ABC-type multidrug transport system ATPase subunit